MIAPLKPFVIKGVIWYQGESNAYPGEASLYGPLIKTIIQDWRNKWPRETSHSCSCIQGANFNPGRLWPELCEGQRMTLTLRNTAMVLTINIGDPMNVHPKNKQDVALPRTDRSAVVIMTMHAVRQPARLRTETRLRVRP
jgi:sialate O-acetylesterase